MSVSALEVEVLASLRRHLHDTQYGAERTSQDASGELQTIEMFHRLGQHCPLDLVAEAVASWLGPLSLAFGRSMSEPVVDAVVGLVLRAANESQRLRFAGAAAEREARAAGGSLQVGELRAALNDSASKCQALEAELSNLQLTHLEACEAFLVKAAHHQRQLEERDAALSDAKSTCNSLAQKLSVAEGELARVKHRLASDTFANRELVFNETSRSNALRQAWDAEQENVKTLRDTHARREAQLEAQVTHLQLQLHECEERSRVLLDFAAASIHCVALEPFRKAVATVSKLRAVLMAQSR